MMYWFHPSNLSNLLLLECGGHNQCIICSLSGGAYVVGESLSAPHDFDGFMSCVRLSLD